MGVCVCVCGVLTNLSPPSWLADYQQTLPRIALSLLLLMAVLVGGTAASGILQNTQDWHAKNSMKFQDQHNNV